MGKSKYDSYSSVDKEAVFRDIENGMIEINVRKKYKIPMPVVKTLFSEYKTEKLKEQKISRANREYTMSDENVNPNECKGEESMDIKSGTMSPEMSLEEKLIDLYVNSDIPVSVIASNNGVPTSQVYIALREKFGSKDKIPFRVGNRVRPNVTLGPRQQEYVRKHSGIKSIHEISEDLKVSQESVVAFMESEGLTVKHDKYRDNNTCKQDTKIKTDVSVVKGDIINFTNQYFEIDGLFKVNKPSSQIEVGLVGERHQINQVSEYIFETALTSEQLSDFAYQYNVCVNFIDKRISSEQDTLVVYCTGLQSVLAMLIKACSDKHVSLTLKHMNPELKIYESQVVWDYNKSAAQSVYPFGNLQNVYTYKCSINDLINMPEAFCVSLGTYDKHDYNFKESIKIMTSEDGAWELYRRFIRVINEDVVTTYNCVSMNSIKFSENAYEWRDRLSYGYNFKNQQNRHEGSGSYRN